MYIDERGKKIFVGREAFSEFFRRLRESRKLHYKTTFQNLPISIENRKGSIRRGTDPDGNEWATKHKVPYGYIRGTHGTDGDHVDVFLGGNEDAAHAFVIHINNPETGEYDEDKVFLGFDDERAALNCFRQHYDEPNKFYSGVDVIPMWKLKDKIFVKKHTSKKLVASRNAFVGGAGNKGDFGTSDKGRDRGGASHIFTSDRTTNPILGKNIMRDPRVREGGPGSGPHAQIIKDAGGKPTGTMEHPTKGTLHTFNDPKTGSTLAMYQKDITSPQAVQLKMMDSRAKFNKGQKSDIDRIVDQHHADSKKESQEYGVKGQKWGVLNPRKDASGARKQAGPRNRQAHRAANKVAQKHSARNISPQERLARFGKNRQNDPRNNHSAALAELKHLGWAILGKAAGLTGMGGLMGHLNSVMSSPTGQRFILQTDPKGNNSIFTQNRFYSHSGGGRGGGGHRGRVHASATFESKMGSFGRLTEAKRGGTYYAREMGRYGTLAEADDLDFIAESFPDDNRVDYPQTRRHRELGMGYFHEKIDRADRVVIKASRKNRLTTGVWSEARHAIKNRIPVYAIDKGKMRRVKSVEVLGRPNKEGEYGRIVFKSRRRK
jgi:hypothetical protein